MLKKIALVSSLTLLTTGCGSDDSSTNNNQSAISSANYVSGEFKNAFDPNSPSSNIAQNISQLNNDLGYCGYDAQLTSGRYYESERMLVVGADALPEDDFKWAATLGELALDNALSAMELNYDQYLELKSGLSSHAIQNLIDMVRTIYTNGNYDPKYHISHYQSILETAFDGRVRTQGYGSESVPDLSVIANYFSSDDLLATRAIYVGLSAMTADEERSLYSTLTNALAAQGVDVDAEFSTEQVVTENIEKMLVCLSSNRSDAEWGMGTRQGFEVATKSKTQRNDDIQIATHEAIHHLQATITHPSLGLAALERWYSEGQAVKLSGMTVTQNSHSRTTLNVITAGDGADYVTQYGQKNEYPDYGQAYTWFTTKFGDDAGLTFLYRLRQSMAYDFTGFSEEQEVFTVEFNKLPKTNCSDDCNYDLSDFRADYPNQDK